MGSTISHCQVLVVGAGPAGGSLAARLARHGIEVLLIDRLACRLRLETLLSGLAGCTASDLSALLFDYRFDRYGRRALPYLLGWR